MKKKLLALATLALASAQACAWDVSIDKDEMDGTRTAYATSRSFSSTRELTFPYQGVRSWLGYGCNKDGEWAYVGFTTTPNIAGDKTRHGYSTNFYRAQFNDEELQALLFSQKWGEAFLNLEETQTDFIHDLETKSTFRMEIPWHSQGNVGFLYSLKGSAEAIKEARNFCAGL